MDRTRRAVRRPPAFGDAGTQAPSSLDRPSSSSPVTSHSTFKSRKSTPPLFSRGALYQKSGTMDPRPRFGRSASFKQGGLATTPAKDGTAAAAANANAGSQGVDSPEKGGHSLRKRTRVNYATEQIEDEVVVPNSSSTARGRKRKMDVGFDEIDSVYGPRNKKRGASVGADTPSTRRRNPSRKTSEIAPFRPFDEDHYGHDDDDDDDIQDTIEVGLSPSEITDEEDEEDEDDDNEDDDKDAENGVDEATKEPVISGEATKTHVGPASTPVPAPPSKAQEDEVVSPKAVIPPAAAETVGQEVAPASSPKLHDAGPLLAAVAKEDDPVVEDATGEGIAIAPTSPPSAGELAEAAPVPAPEPEPETVTVAAADDAADDAAATTTIAATTDSAPASSPAPALAPAGDARSPTPLPPAPSSSSPSSPPPPPPSPPSAVKPVTEESREALQPPESTPLVPGDEPRSEQVDDVAGWARLTTWVDGEWTIYPEKLARSDEDDAASEAPSLDGKEAIKEASDALAPADDADTPAPEVPDLAAAAATSPPAVVEEPEDAEGSGSQEPLEKTRQYRYRKLPDADDFTNVLENYGDMSTTELFDMLAHVNESMVDWEREFHACNKIIDDYENAERRRAADAKYEARTRNLNQHGVNYEEADLVLKGYKAKEKEGSSETRYLQQQDRIMAAAYGFEYDPHPSKIGRQNPAAQQAGMTTRGRALRNQPRQTAKATELEVGVIGKRQRKPVQLFDPAPLDESRHSTPVPTRKRRRNANADGNDEAQASSFTASFQAEPSPDAEAPATGGRRKRVRKAPARIIEEPDTPTFSVFSQDHAAHDEQTKAGGRRGRPKVLSKADDIDSVRPSIENETNHSEPVPTRMLTLKIPKGTHFSGPSSAITDNGDSRPSTANSDSTTHTVESSYSFRPKRQKRFRDAPSDTEDTPEEPPKKKKRTINIVKKRASPDELASVDPEQGGPASSNAAGPSQNGPEPATARKGKSRATKPKDVESRNGTPASQQTDGGDEPPKDYHTMTKSEKMSASMRNRWKNGNMQKAVEKRKATLAAKKAAQVAAEQRNGALASRPEAGPSQTAQAPTQPTEPTPFTHGYQSAVSQNPKQAQQQQAQQQQPTQPHPADFGAGYPYQH